MVNCCNIKSVKITYVLSYIRYLYKDISYAVFDLGWFYA